MRKIFDHDGVTGITTWWHVDPSTGAVSVEKSQDVTAIAEVNKKEIAGSSARDGWGEMAKVASLPLTVYYDLKRRGILGDQKALTKWLNDSENRLFRTREGTL
jgi:hypothetical protein